jgi:hypothetical protein
VEWECSCESSIITGDGWSWSDGGVFLFYPQGFAAINRFLTASGGMRVENLSSCCKNLLGGLAYAKLNAFGLTRWARRAGDPSLRLKGGSAQDDAQQKQLVLVFRFVFASGILIGQALIDGDF